jgi:hypothetical protein
MRKLTLIPLLVFMLASLTSQSQTKNLSAGSKADSNSKPGLINITEFNIGIGLNETDRDYAKRIFNLSSIFGIGITKNLTGGIGAGVSLYNGGTLVPLFADFRYFINLARVRVFGSADGGILLNSAKTEGGTKILVSPGAGLEFPVSNRLSLNLGAGLLVQLMKDHNHDSFANIKAGMTYFFNKRKH